MENWNRIIAAHVLGATQLCGHHYIQKGLLNDLYVRKIFLDFYGGLHGSEGNHNLEHEQEQEIRS